MLEETKKEPDMISFNKLCPSTNIGQIVHISEFKTLLFNKYKYALCFEDEPNHYRNIAVSDSIDELKILADMRMFELK